jgi:hypothetical protein
MKANEWKLPSRFVLALLCVKGNRLLLSEKGENRVSQRKNRGFHGSIIGAMKTMKELGTLPL